ncbi:MAG: dual specificity protein phosphatase family protein [Alphaproteobacteria bacterium]|nr:dual specificity protein phosphatase family protein [Alphaproteobacteria bacterium]
MVMSRWRWWKIAGLCLLVLIANYAAYAGVLHLTGNFHEVVPGELYRSAQPTAQQIARYKAHYGIKTVVNLRGRNLDHEWYRQELAASRALGITHIDFRMSARKLLSEPRAAELLSILRSARKPILVHCRGGADRSGLVSALYLAMTGHGEDEAEAQISPRFGHVGVPFLSKTHAMDESFERLEPWLGFPHS